MKKILILLFFLTQIGLIFFNLGKGAKFFNWAMYHTKINYSAKVYINGIELDDLGFYKRYKIPKKGSEYRALQILKRKMTQRELLKNDGSKILIELNYTENTHKGKWTWTR